MDDNLTTPDEDINIALQEVEFLVLNEALQTANRRSLFKIDVGGTFVMVPPKRIEALARKMDYIMRKLKNSGV